MNLATEPDRPFKIPRGTKILVRGVNWLGDAVMSTPALMRLREASAGASISLLTHEKLIDLWQDHPAVDRVIPFAPGEGVWRVSSRLREHAFDLGLILPNSSRSALEQWLAGIPTRVGYARPGRTWLLTHPLAPRPDEVRMHKRTAAEVRRLVNGPEASSKTKWPAAAHHSYQYLHLVASVGADPTPQAPLVVVSEHEVATVRARFQLGATEARVPTLITVNAGAEYGPAKRWPTERFVEAIVRVQSHISCHWVIVGGANDVALANEIAAGVRRKAAFAEPRGPSSNSMITVLAGKTSLRELSAVLKASRLLLTNDSGPMHLAAAVGTRVIALFGSTTPELTGPGLPNDATHIVIRTPPACAPCFRRDCPIDMRCLNNIDVDQVVSAVLQTAGEAR